MDDFSNYPGWKNGPFKALEENIPKDTEKIISQAEKFIKKN